MSLLAPLSRRLLRLPSTAPHLSASSPLYIGSSFPSSVTTIHTTSITQSSRLYSTTKMAEQMSFLDAVRNRRSIYPLTDKIPITDERVKEIVTEAIKHVPSSFNSQSTRLVVLLNEEHNKFWEFVKEVLKPQMPEDQFPKTEQKLDMFKAAHGTILFLDDPAPVNKLASQYAAYAQHFPGWAVQSNAMHQYMLWTALEAEGLGCNLQHYNPIIDQKAKNEWNIPLEWDLRAQLVFGAPAEGARESVDKGGKQFQPVEERVFIHGAK